MFQQPTIVDFRLMPYEEALGLQMRVHAEVSSGSGPERILLGEHPTVLTYGKNTTVTELHVSEQFLAAQGVKRIEIDRGGQMTLHNPGQLVVYPILRVAERHLGARKFVSVLEKSLVDTLQDFGIVGAPDPDNPGVWIENKRKIAAIGIRISKRVSMHGLCLNIRNALEPYNWFVPCGIRDRSVTSLERELALRNQKTPGTEEVRSAFLGNLLKAILV